MQQGEFYPEHHITTVQRLQELYPEFSHSEIDAIYRQACLIDFEVQKLIGKSQLTRQAQEDLLDWLKDNFYGFPEACFLWAIERAQSM